VSECVVDRTPVAGDLRAEWLRLFESSARPTLEAHPDFFLGTAPTDAGSRLHVARLGENALVVGLRRQQPVHCRVGYVGTRTPALRRLDVVLGGLIHDGSEASRRVLLDHFRDLLQREEVELLVVHHLARSDPLWDPLCRGLDRTGRAVHRPSITWVADLLDAEGVQALRHSARTRATWRRKDRRIRERFSGDLRIEVIDTPAGAGPFVASAAAICARGYQGALGVGVSDDETWRRRVGCMAAMGALRAFLLLARNEPIAYLVGPLIGRSFRLDATAFDPAHRELSPGEYLLRHVMRQLASEGVAEFDFGYGDMGYKRMHATRSFPEATLRLYGPGARARLARAMDLGILQLNQGTRAALNRFGAFEAVRKLWRRRIEPSDQRERSSLG